MTDIKPIKKPPQSMFHPEDDVDVIELRDEECKDVDHENSTTEAAPLPSSNNKQSLQLRLDSATLKVENASKIADIVMLRVKDRVSQYKDTLNQAAIRIDNENAAELKAIQKRRKRMSTISDTFKETTKRNEKLLQLEKLKVEVMEVRSEERRVLKNLVRRQKEISNKIRRDEEETPTQILENSKYFTIGEDEDDDDDTKTLTHDTKQPYDDVVIEKEEKLQQNDLQQQEIYDEHQEQSEKHMTIEEMRLAARAEAAEEIRQAKEVRRHEMAKFTTEREETKLAEESGNMLDLEQTKLDKNSGEALVGGVQISTLCRLLECSEDELFDQNFSDSSFEPTIEIIDNSTTDIDIIQCTIADHVKAIVEYDTSVSDIELMQSIILAENAALKGKDEFRLGLEEQLNNVMHDCSFSPIDKENNRSSKQTEPLQANFSPRFGSISKRAGLAMKSFRLAAAKMDRQQRMEQKRRVMAQ